MKNLRILFNIIGGASILLGIMLLVGVLLNTGNPNNPGLNTLLLVIFVAAFWAMGAGLLYVAHKLQRAKS